MTEKENIENNQINNNESYKQFDFQNENENEVNKNKLDTDMENTSDMNNIDQTDSHPSIPQSEDEYKKQNKIKLNHQALVKSSTDSNIKKEITNINNSVGNINPQNLYNVSRAKIFNMTIKSKKLFTMMLLFLSLLIFLLSFFDFLKNLIKGGKLKINDYILTHKLVFTCEVLIINLIIIFQILNYFYKLKDIRLILIIHTLIFIISCIIRVMIFTSKKTSILSFSGNLLYAALMCNQECLTLYILATDEKKQKNALHNIEEIINFTELNAASKKTGTELKLTGSTPNTENENENDRKNKNAELVEE